MNNQNKAFTLVELIVVISILAILWTIAFISLQGYWGDAKNTKVVSDLRNLAGALETVRTTKDTRLSDVVTNINTSNIIANTSIVNGSWAIISDSDLTYVVGNIDFSKLGQNGEEFKDPNSFDENQDYVYAAIFHPDFSGFQFAWQIIELEQKKSRLTGTYAVKDEVQDAKSIISSRANEVPLEDNELMTGDLYQ